MTRILLRSRRLMAVSILLMLSGVMVLSAATRRPCLRASTAPWHVFKAGHMTKSEGVEIGALRLAAEAQTLRVALKDSPPPAPLAWFPHEESIPPANSIVVQLRHFRAPPARG